MSSAEKSQPDAERGTLPDAPLAMPKQVLTASPGFSLRKLFGQRTLKTGS